MELIEKVAIFQNAQVFPDLHADLLFVSNTPTNKTEMTMFITKSNYNLYKLKQMS